MKSKTVSTGISNVHTTEAAASRILLQTVNVIKE
jgi:hypothetical protein